MEEDTAEDTQKSKERDLALDHRATVYETDIDMESQDRPLSDLQSETASDRVRRGLSGEQSSQTMAPSTSGPPTDYVTKQVTASVAVVDYPYHCSFPWPLQDFQAEMTALTNRLLEFKDLLTEIVNFQKGEGNIQRMAELTYRDPRSKTLRLPRYSQASSSSDEPPPIYTAVETQLLRLFPIPVYTPAIDWLLKQPVVKTFIFYQMTRRQYTNIPRGKPDWEIVIADYLDFMCTIRLQGHMGKAGSKSGKLHFGRFPLPDAILQISNENIASLHRVRVPGDRDNATLFREKCAAIKRNRITYAEWVMKSESVQEMAQKYLWERYDFYINHRVSCSCSLTMTSSH